jgi:D-galactose 1-dehydrogenase
MSPCSIAVVGVGKIARDQHLPVIGKDPRFRLAGLVSTSAQGHAGAPVFGALAELFAAVPEVDAVAICTPPGARHALAREALAAGRHVLLEKPPAPTVSELDDLADFADDQGLVLFAAWHSQFAPAVEKARALLRGARLARLAIDWREDVRRWHPGQEWVWRAGGFGVFDPGVNALSILTRIAPAPIFVRSAELSFPENRDAPIAARLAFSSPCARAEASLEAAFDWREEGEQSWTVDIKLEDGRRLVLSEGGARLDLDGRTVVDAAPAEYDAIYARLAALLERGESDVDAAPFQLMSDAFAIGSRRMVASFDW